MKKAILALAAALLLAGNRAWALSPEEVHARGCVLMEADSGRVLFEKNGDLPLPMASTTKILTALLALEEPDQQEWFTVDPEAIRAEGSSMGLREGDQVTLDALVTGMLLPSGNDAAGAAAVRIAGDIESFVREMNRRAASLGMEHSHFVTPSGLDAPGHESSARDMALLTREALLNERFREICRESSMAPEFGNPPHRRRLTNYNRFLRLYEPAIGVKTGFTDDAGRCLVTAAEQDGVTLIAVTLGCPDDFSLHQKLYEEAFARYPLRDLSHLAGALEVPVAGGEQAVVRAVPAGRLACPLAEEELAGLRPVTEMKKFLYAPVEKNDIIGSIKLYQGDTLVLERPLAAAEAVAPLHRVHWWERLFGALSGSRT